MTSDPNLMNRLVTEEQNRIKLLVAKFSEMMQLAGVSVIIEYIEFETNWLIICGWYVYFGN